MSKKRRKISLGPRKPFFLKEWRKHRRLTQEQLAERLDISTSHISQLERGTLNYTRETLEALAYALTCEPGDLLARNPSAPVYQLWEVITNMDADKQKMALRLLKTLAEEAA